MNMKTKPVAKIADTILDIIDPKIASNIKTADKLSKNPRDLIAIKNARENVLRLANKSHKQKIQQYMAEDPNVLKAQTLWSSIINSNRGKGTGSGFNSHPNFKMFLEAYKPLYLNKHKSKKDFYKFKYVYDTLSPSDYISQSKTFKGRVRDRKADVNSLLVKEMNIPDSQKMGAAQARVSLGLRGDTSAGTPSYVFDEIQEEIANVVSKYRQKHYDDFGSYPTGTGQTRDSFTRFLQNESPLVDSYLQQVGFNVDNNTLSINMKNTEIKKLFNDAKKDYPDQIGDFNPGTKKSIRSSRDKSILDDNRKDFSWSNNKYFDDNSEVSRVINNFRDDIASSGTAEGHPMYYNRKNVDAQINRMFTAGIKAGKPMDEIIENVTQSLKNADRKTFPKINEILDKKFKIRKRIEEGRAMGMGSGMVDNINLGHIVDVAHDYKLGLNMDNLFLLPQKPNIAQYQKYDKQLKTIQQKLNSPNTRNSISEQSALQDELSDLGIELERQGIVTDVGYGRIGKAKDPDALFDMFDENVKFYEAQPPGMKYTDEMNKRIVEDGAQGPGFASGGEVDITEEKSFMDYLFPKTFEYPYKVGGNEPLYNPIPKEGKTKAVADAISLQDARESLDSKSKQRKMDFSENENVKNFKKSKEVVDYYDDVYQQNLFGSILGITPEEADAVASEEIDMPDFRQGSSDVPLTMEVIEEQEDIFDSDEYKDKTAFMTAPQFKDKKYKAVTDILKNDLSGLSNDVQRFMLGAWANVVPIGFAAETVSNYHDLNEPGVGGGMTIDRFLPKEVTGDKYDGDYYNLIYDSSTGKGTDYAEAMGLLDDNGDIQVELLKKYLKNDIVPSTNLNVDGGELREPTALDAVKTTGLVAAAALPYFMFGNISQVMGRTDIRGLGKLMRIAPQLFGIPTPNEAKQFAQLLLRSTLKLGKTPFDKSLRKNITLMVNELQANATMEKSDKYYKDKLEESTNPKYSEERQILIDNLIEIYTNKPLKEKDEKLRKEKTLKQTNDILSLAKNFEDLPTYVRDLAIDEAFQILGIKKSETKFMPEETLFEEVTGIDVSPGERDTMPISLNELKKMSTGGDPGEFTDSVISGEEEVINIDPMLRGGAYESIEDLDMFEEASNVPQIPQRENIFDDENSYEVANVGRVPGWAVTNLSKLDSLAPLGPQIKNLLRIGDEIAETTTTQGEKVGRFYSNLEARLLDPNAPEVFETPADLYNFLNSKGIGKIEVDDYQIPQLIETFSKSEKPITKADLLARIREAPIRKLETKVFGFRSEVENGDEFINGKYPNAHMEKGYIPDTYRENVVFINPSKIPNDPKSYEYSTHGFFNAENMQYVVGWSRLSDRYAINPGSATQLLSPEKTKQISDLNKKIERLTKLSQTSAEDLITRSGGRVTVDQAAKNITQAQKDLIKAQKNLEDLNSKVSKIPNQSIKVTFADEIQSDIFQTYRKTLEVVKKDYQKLLQKNINPKDKYMVDASGDIRSNTDIIQFYDKHKDIMRPMFRTAEDLEAYINELTQSNKVFEDFAKIKPGQLQSNQLKLVQDAAKKRDKVLAVFEEANTNPETLKKLFPNIPFKDRKAWGDIIVKNDLHSAAKRLFIDKDPNASTWYAISPAELVQIRYGQSGTTGTALAERTKNMKGIGTGEFYGGPNAVDPSGKHYTGILEESLKRAANINNSEFKVIKVSVGKPKKIDKVIDIVDEGGNIVKTFKVKKTDDFTSTLNKAMKYIEDSGIEGLKDVPREVPSGFKTVDAYAIKLTPEMILPSKTHFASGGYVQSPLVDIEELIGA